MIGLFAELFEEESLRILVACEESQAVTLELRSLGHEAYSCDLLPCSGGRPDIHLQGDVIPLLAREWDMIIAFPPCTYLTVTGNRWFNEKRYGQQAVIRKKKRAEAIRFFNAIAQAPCSRIAIENPVGIMSTEWRRPDQIVNPYLFGDPYEKKTCLWLKGLPILQPTKIVKPERRREYASGVTMPPWYAEAWGLPPEERSKLRSKTFPGIAKAMATQWTT